MAEARAEDHAADAAKAVDSDFDTHDKILSYFRNISNVWYIYYMLLFGNCKQIFKKTAEATNSLFFRRKFAILKAGNGKPGKDCRDAAARAVQKLSGIGFPKGVIL